MSAPGEATSEDQEVMDALATGLRSVEIGRRVGWAKAFDALRRVEELEEEVRDLRDRHKYLQRAYSRLLGVLSKLDMPKSEALDAELAGHAAAERTFRDTGAWRAGVAVARKHLYERGRGNRRKEIATEAKHEFFSQQRNKLRDEAERLGHQVGRTGEGLSEERCSCGWSSGELPDHHKLVQAALNHHTHIVHGLTAKEWSQSLREAQQEAVQAAVTRWEELGEPPPSAIA